MESPPATGSPEPYDANHGSVLGASPWVGVSAVALSPPSTSSNSVGVAALFACLDCGGCLGFTDTTAWREVTTRPPRAVATAMWPAPRATTLRRPAWSSTMRLHRAGHQAVCMI